MPEGMLGKYQYWFNILPFFYEALPIIVIYTSHVINFRKKNRGQTFSQSLESEYESGELALREGTEGARCPLLAPVHSAEKVFKEHSLRIGTDLIRVESATDSIQDRDSSSDSNSSEKSQVVDMASSESFHTCRDREAYLVTSQSLHGYNTIRVLLGDSKDN